METVYFEVPGESRKEDAIAYINEFYEYGSEINGSGDLHRFLEHYEDWLVKLEKDSRRIPDGNRVSSRTYFLVRGCDSHIVGLINIRLVLNERLKEYGGHIGFGIRPTERGKGYNKTNLHLGLKVCQEHGIDTVLMDADVQNPASWRTMEALGGRKNREFYDGKNAHCMVRDYEIDVNESLIRAACVYEPMVEPVWVNGDRDSL